MYRSTVARLNCWVVDRPDQQHPARVCSKSAANMTSDDWVKLKRIGRYVKEFPHIGIMFAWQNAPTRLTVQSDSEWTGERKTRKDQSTIAMNSGEAELYAACVAAQQARGMENMAREQGVNFDAKELRIDATAAIGTIGRQRLGRVRHWDLSYLWLQAAVQRQTSPLAQSTGDDMAGIGTKALKRDTIQKHLCVPFDQLSQGTLGRTGL